MYRRPAHRFAALISATLLAGLMSSCATAPARPVVALPNGYDLTPTPADQSQIVKRRGGVVLPGPIAAYAVSDDIVAGALGMLTPSSHLYPDRPFSGNPSTRYFILDTASGKLETDLSVEDWHERLKALGVPSDFQIYPPLPWQQ